MIQERYVNKFRTVMNYETFGALVCFALSIYITIHFGALDKWYLKVCGIFTIAFLFIIPILVLKALIRIKQVNILDKTYKETMTNYLKAKANLLRLQRFAISASFILIFAVSAVFSKIWGKKDFFMAERNVEFYIKISFAVLFVILVTRWGYRLYKNMTDSAENILKELQ